MELNKNIILRTAYEFLIQYNISSLPISIRPIFETKRVFAIPYTSIQNELLSLEEIRLHEKKRDALVYACRCSDGNEVFVIGYNDTVSTDLQRYAIMHEIGHIKLGHIVYDTRNILGFVDYADSELDEEANIFARHALCPPAVLLKKFLKSPSDIAITCNVPVRVAKEQSKYMGNYKLPLFLWKNQIESRIIRQFDCELSSELCDLSSLSLDNITLS